jgi:hypothetical protein
MKTYPAVDDDGCNSDLPASCEMNDKFYRMHKELLAELQRQLRRGTEENKEESGPG